jgi:hypothetical protein
MGAPRNGLTQTPIEIWGHELAAEAPQSRYRNKLILYKMGVSNCTKRRRGLVVALVIDVLVLVVVASPHISV